MTNVYCYPADRDSAYVPLLFTGIEDRYRPICRPDGTLEDALREIDAGRDVIVHVHWEEFVLRDCASEAEADAQAARFARLVSTIGERNVRIVWTVHNELPHVIPFRRQFLALRAVMAAHAEPILVHNAASLEILAKQVDLNPANVHLLPHPSYLDRYEDGTALRAGLATSPERLIQGFGWIRRQKGFSEMIDMLPVDFLESLGARVRISGGDAEAAAVIAERPERTDVSWDVRHVPNGEVPSLLRSATCVVLPYERVLTSGVAHLAISVGAILIAVDVPQMRELLPERSRRFLYPRGDGRALRAAVAAAFALSARDRREIVDANLEVARRLHPSTIARRLAAIYDARSSCRS